MLKTTLWNSIVIHISLIIDSPRLFSRNVLKNSLQNFLKNLAFFFFLHTLRCSLPIYRRFSLENYYVKFFIRLVKRSQFPKEFSAFLKIGENTKNSTKFFQNFLKKFYMIRFHIFFFCGILSEVLDYWNSVTMLEFSQNFHWIFFFSEFLSEFTEIPKKSISPPSGIS